MCDGSGTRTATACKKYEDGPGLSFRSKKKRIANTWKALSFHKNGVDSTMYYISEGSELNLEEDGTVSLTIYQNLGNPDTVNAEGRWELHEKDKAFALILTDLKTNEVDTTAWWIARLKEKEFWLREDDNDGDGNFDEELRLVPKE